MNDIDLQEAKIKFEGEWFSVEGLTGMIQEKMDAGDMKLSAIAKALEELNNALENSHTIEAKIVIPTADYEKLLELGGEDDLNCVRKAVMAFIGGKVGVQPASDPAAEPEGKKVKTVKCTKCKAAIDIPADEVPSEIKCPDCGTTGRLKSQDKS
jgi:predicted RNA-binding Zn-ribbon protein involved in translation (DUF1610 family)